MPDPVELAEWLAPYSPTTQQLALDVRRKLLALLPACVETIWDGAYAVVFTYGPSEKTREHVIHVPVYAKHVNLGFNWGATLEDPTGRLEGKGSQVRHVRILDPATLDEPDVRALIDQAAAFEPVEPQTLVRSMKGAKKRTAQ